MYLRKLKAEDAPAMLEWMHDKSVVCHLGANFAEKTIDDCNRFIAWANETDTDLHLAVADEDDTYMGTVSLKHLDRIGGTAEFAITVRACAMGKGFSHFGMDSILKKGISEEKLNAIYWCVSPKNERAVRFYDKHGYTRTTAVPATISQAYPQDMELIWYVYTG